MRRDRKPAVARQWRDGNGRMARLWHTALLARWNPLFAYIPLESQIERFQDAYYDAIARCHREGASTTFILFMLSQTDRVLDEVLAQLRAEDAAGNRGAGPTAQQKKDAEAMKF